MTAKPRKSTGSRKSAAKPAARKKSGGPKNKRKGTVPTASGAVETTHNGGAREPGLPLNAEQSMALHHRHTEEYKKALDKKKKSDADFKNACKLIKAEGGSLALIKMQLMEPEALERHIRETVGDFRTIAEYNAMPIGGQLELLDKPDRTPGDVRARKAGRVVGMQGGDRTPPFAPNLPQASAWLQGYDEGQEILRETMKKKTAMKKDQPGDTKVIKGSGGKKSPNGKAAAEPAPEATAEAGKGAEAPSGGEGGEKEQPDRGAGDWLDEAGGGKATESTATH